jgi:hypothetical protein
MIVKKTEKKSNYLDLSKVERKEISIQFSLDGFSFCVQDLDLLEYIYFKTFTFSSKIKNPEELLKHIKQLFITEEELSQNFETINVIHENNLSSFVPMALFNKNNIKDYISFNNKTYKSDYFIYDQLATQDMNAVYIPYINVNNFLIDQFGSFYYKHYSSILVETLLNNFSINNEKYLFIHATKTHLEIIACQNKKLLFYNSFDYITKEDFIYYILFTIEQLKLNTETINLQFLGTIDLKSDLYEITYQYIRNVSFIEDKFKFNSIIGIDNKIIRENFSLFHF